MEQIFSTIQVKSSGQGLQDITFLITNFIKENKIKTGLIVLNLSLIHI